MIEHLRDHCDKFNIGVLCEIYDGQFLNLIQRGEFGQPLTKLQLMKDIYNECKKLSKDQLIKFLIHYSCENPKQLNNIITPRNKLNMYLDYLFNVLEEELSGENKTRQCRHGTNLATLQNDDLDVLLCGSQLGRWRLARCLSMSDSESGDNEESFDEDYNPLCEIESDLDLSHTLSETSFDLNDELQNLIDTSSDNEVNFLNELLQKFQNLNNKHDWKNTNANEFAKTFLVDKKVQ